MKLRCQRAVSFELGRPLRDGEADIYSARIVEELRRDAKDRDTWNSRSREQHLRAVGDRMYRELPDRALAQERKKTDAMSAQLEALDRQIAALQTTAPRAEPRQVRSSERFIVTAFDNSRQAIWRNPTLQQAEAMTKHGDVLGFVRDEAGDVYVWMTSGLTADEIENQLHGVGARLAGEPGTLQTHTIMRDGDVLMTSGGTSAAVLLDGGRTYNQADGLDYGPPADFTPGARTYAMGDATISYNVSETDALIEITGIDTPTVKRGRQTERATLQSAAAAVGALLRQADTAERTVFVSLVEADAEDYARNTNAQKQFWQGLGFFTNRGARKDARSSADLVRQPRVYLQKDALDMSPDARMERARAQGFDVSRTLYHGSVKDLAEIKRLHGVRAAKSEQLGEERGMNALGVWLSNRGDEAGASMYVPRGQGAVYPVYARIRNPLIFEGSAEFVKPDVAFGKFLDFLQERTADQGEFNLIDDTIVRRAASVQNRDMKPVREWLLSQGYDAVIIRNTWGDSTPSMPPQDMYVILRDEDTRSVYAAFDPDETGSTRLLAHTGAKTTGETIIRGATTFHEGANERVLAATMRLTEAANLSTFLHESGHIFLEIIRDMATREGATAEIRSMWADILDWFDIDGNTLPDVPQHELFARTFEAYLRKGKAPSLSLQRIFDTFRKWLSKLYEAVSLQHNLTPEITSVFDRMFASDAEIAKAREINGQSTPLFRNAEEAGMSAAEWESYLRKRDDAEAQARASLTATAMDAYFRQQTAWWNRQLGKARRRAGREIDSDPARRVHDWLAYGKWRGEIARNDRRNGEEMEPDWGLTDPPAGLAPMALNLKAVADDYGPAMVAALPDALKPVDEAQVAELVKRARRARSAGKQRNAPRRLASFVVQMGGLRDDGGDVLAILGSHRARPGLINNSSGRSIDDAALAAWEAGYFGAKPTKGVSNFDDNTYYQEDLIIDTNARLQNIRVVPAQPGGQPKLGEVISLKVGDPDADFYIVRRGSAAAVGSVTKEYNPQHYGVRVTRPDVMVPDYLYYALMHVHTQGFFKQLANGTTQLVNIKQRDVLNIPLGPPLPATPETRGGTLAEGGATLDTREPLKPRIYYSSDADARPTIAQFLDALESDLRGEPVYKVEDLEDVWASQEDREAGYWFEQRNIDIEADAKTLRAAITAYIQSQGAGPNALHPDVLASEFNRVLGTPAFASGHELLQALTSVRPRRQLVEALAAKMVRDEYGDPFQDGTMEAEAQSAAHRAAQSRVLELELEALSQATGGHGRALSRAARKLAKDRVAKMTVRQLRAFERILGQERKHARQAVQAMAQGNLVEAALEKHAQIIAFHTYAEARDAAADIEKMERRFRAFDSPNTRRTIDPEHLGLIDSVLGQFELRRISLKEEGRREKLISYVLKMTQQGMDHLLAIDLDLIKKAERQPFGKITYDDAKSLFETIRNLEHLGRLKQGLLVKRERRRIQDVENEIVASIENNGPKHKDAGNARRVESETELEKAEGTRQEFHAENSKEEFIFRLLDGLVDNGPVWRHLFRPIAEAEAAELEMGAMAAERTQRIFSVYTKKERERMFRVRYLMPMIGERLTKAQQMAVALNSGTEYGRQILMAGYNWTEDQLMDIINRLDKRDLDVVQAIWDWLEEYREPSFALAERLTGVRPQAVEASPLNTWHGIYRGGYYRVKYDPKKHERTNQNEQATTVRDALGANVLRPATKKGMLIERRGSGGQKVRLDLNVLQEAVGETIHYITHEEAVIDTARLIERPAIQDAIIGAVGRDQYRQLKPWINEVARMPKPPDTSFERIMTRVGNNVSVVAMGWKVSTAIVQPLGILGAIPRLGVGPVARQVSRLYGHPDRLSAAFKFVTERSAAMRHRVDTYDRDVRDAMVSIANKADGDPVPANIRRTFFWLTSTMDMGVVIPVWLAAYDQAMRGKVANIDINDAKAEDAAIQYADSVVRMTQGSGSLKDQANLMRRKGFMRLFTKFMSYFNTLYNQLYNEQVPGLAMGRIPVHVFAINMAWLWFLPAVLAELLQGRVGDEPPEEELRKLAITTATYPLMSIVGVRDLVSGSVSDYGYEISPVTAAGEAVAGVGGDIISGDIGESTLKQAWMASGYWWGLPSRQLWITFDYAKDTATGTEQPLEEPERIWTEGLVRDTR